MNTQPISDEHWAALLKRDRDADGSFVFGVVTTGVYCRPSCPARRPRRDNTLYFSNCNEAEKAGLRPCERCRPRRQSAAPDYVLRAAAHIRELACDAEQRVTLASLARFAGVSATHLQKEFRRYLGLSPRAYLQACRFQSFKQRLRKSPTVTDAMLDAGYGSARGLYDSATGRLGMKPAAYRKGAAGEELRFTVIACALGRLVLAASARGVCAVQFITREHNAVSVLRSEFPAASFTRDDDGLAEYAEQVQALLETKSHTVSLPLDLRGTVFQQQVWEHLRKIPFGQTQSYAQVAKALGKPNAVRAVASACSGNRLAVLVPCHRVVSSDGSLAGYRWGVERKRALIAGEREAARS